VCILKNIKITTEYITLGQFLKLSNIISSGGEAKFFLQENVIYVNNELENRRGRKLYPNDKIKVVKYGEYQIVL
jgi:S4 domain protein YaaA